MISIDQIFVFSNLNKIECNGVGAQPFSDLKVSNTFEKKNISLVCFIFSKYYIYFIHFIISLPDQIYKSS